MSVETCDINMLVVNRARALVGKTVTVDVLAEGETISDTLAYVLHNPTRLVLQHRLEPIEVGTVSWDQ